MECEKFKKMEIDELLASGSESKFLEFQQHISQCASCRALYKERLLIKTFLTKYYNSIPINFSEKEKAIRMIESYRSQPVFSFSPAIVFAVFLLLISLGIYEYTKIYSIKVKEENFIATLVSLHTNNTLQWLPFHYRKQPYIYKKLKLKEPQVLHYSQDMKVMRFKIGNFYASFFVLDKNVYKDYLDRLKYLQVGNKYVCVCNKKAHIWISDVPLEEIVKKAIRDCPYCSSLQGLKISLKLNKPYCPCCLVHLMKVLRKYKSCIINVDYKNLQVMLSVQSKKYLEKIRQLF